MLKTRETDNCVGFKIFEQNFTEVCNPATISRTEQNIKFECVSLKGNLNVTAGKYNAHVYCLLTFQELVEKTEKTNFQESLVVCYCFITDESWHSPAVGLHVIDNLLPNCYLLVQEARSDNLC